MNGKTSKILDKIFGTFWDKTNPTLVYCTEINNSGDSGSN